MDNEKSAIEAPPKSQIVIDFADPANPHVQINNVGAMQLWAAQGILGFYAEQMHINQQLAVAQQQADIASVVDRLAMERGRH